MSNDQQGTRQPQLCTCPTHRQIRRGKHVACRDEVAASLLRPLERLRRIRKWVDCCASTANRRLRQARACRQKAPSLQSAQITKTTLYLCPDSRSGRL